MKGKIRDMTRKRDGVTDGKGECKRERKWRERERERERDIGRER